MLDNVDILGFALIFSKEGMIEVVEIYFWGDGLVVCI